METRTAASGQVEMTMQDTPLFEASEKLSHARQEMLKAKAVFKSAEKDWCAEMKEVKKANINHDGNIISIVSGKTSEEHSRFA